jgi:hypothetical protein
VTGPSRSRNVAEPRFVAHLGAVYVNGTPAGRSMMRLIQRAWSDLRDIAETFAGHRRLMRELHTTYRAKRRRR